MSSAPKSPATFNSSISCGIAQNVRPKTGLTSGVAVAADTVLRVRLRMAEADHLNVFICTNTASGGFAGNFTGAITLARRVERAGWQTLERPFRSARAGLGLSRRISARRGHRVRFLLLTATRPFEVSAPEIVRR